jgi:hypothetical protein
MERTFVRYDRSHTLVLTRKVWDPETGEGYSETRRLTLPERILWRLIRRTPRFGR